MILALNLIDLKNRIIPEKSLKIIEQIPEETEINDVTNVLKLIYYSLFIYDKCEFIKILNDNKNFIIMIRRISPEQAYIEESNKNKKY